MSPLIRALFIVLGVGLVGALAAFVRDRMRYSGYRDIMREALGFAKSVEGEVFRDAGDLVISGEQQKMPLIVRFSHAENTPGLSVRVGAPATFSMQVFPRGQHEASGALVRTADDVFNTKFEVRSDQPTIAQLFLGSPRVLAGLAQLCRSGHDFLTIGSGAIEFGQLGYPNPTTARALPGIAGALNTLRQGLAEMPGAEQVKVEPRARRRDWILRATIAAGVVAVAATLYVSAYDHGKDETPRQAIRLPEGMSVEDAAIIPNLAGWRSATASDTDEMVNAWLRDRGLQFASHLTLDATGNGEKNDRAYLLVNDKGERRVILIVHGAKVYDARFPQVGAIARIAKGMLAQVQWHGPAPSDAEGDGLLLVRNGQDNASGVVLYLGSGNRVQSVLPANWQSVRIATD